ncbi:MAG: efflux RND transporter periplasmic adaptor subunit [Pseudomonadota bacterium]
MRILSVIVAILVCVAIYFVVLDRDRLLAFAARFQPDAPAETAQMGDAEAASEADATEAMAETEDDGLVHVLVVASRASTVSDEILLRGRTEAARQVTASAETSGRVVSEPIRAGAFVEEGAVMCRIDPGTRQAALAEARANLATAEARLPEAIARQDEAEAALTAAQIDANAASRLSESGFASETRAATTAASLRAAEAAIRSAAAGVEAASSGIESAEAGVTRAEEEISRLEIVAPFAGLLETDTAEIGSLLQPGVPCATIIELDPMKLVGFVPESQVDRLELGRGARAVLSSGREITGDVTFLSRSADPQTRTFRVEVTVDNADLSIRDGQTADIFLATAGEPAHLLPGSAMTLNDDGQLGMRIVEDGIVAFVPIRVLRDTQNGVVVTGLPEEADVIVVGQEFVTQGVPVRVSYQELTQ